jgi:GntR family transcriptional regulator, arabinose operon transcriptional repressor
MARDSQPKYQDVQDYLLDCIRKGDLLPGSKAPSENELSRRFGISRLTARHALTELVNAGILQRQQGSGTFVRERSRRIGVCMTYVDTYIFPDILKGIDEILRRHQYILVLTCSNNELGQEEKVLGNLLEQNLDGLIWEPARSACRGPDDRLLAQVRQSQLPTVLINSPLDFPEAGEILTADAAGMALLVNHLYGLGHRRFAGLFCQDLTQGVCRREGLVTALANLGLSIAPKHLMWFDSRDLLHGFDQIAGPWLKELKTDRVTALCCYNDRIAQLCSPLLRQIGIQVPQDLSLTGFDAIERLMQPPDHGYGSEPPLPRLTGLTTVAHPCAQLGRQAAECLIALVSQALPADQLKLEMPTELIIGSSTSQPKDD